MTQSAKPTDPPSTGFIIVERVLHEYRDGGKSPSLEKFKSQLDKGLQQFQADAATPKVAKEVQAVESAMAQAVELIETLRKDATRK